jgi:hypothetical protein
VAILGWSVRAAAAAWRLALLLYLAGALLAVVAAVPFFLGMAGLASSGAVVAELATPGYPSALVELSGSIAAARLFGEPPPQAVGAAARGSLVAGGLALVGLGAEALAYAFLAGGILERFAAESRRDGMCPRPDPRPDPLARVPRGGRPSPLRLASAPLPEAEGMGLPGGERIGLPGGEGIGRPGGDGSARSLPVEGERPTVAASQIAGTRPAGGEARFWAACRHWLGPMVVYSLLAYVALILVGGAGTALLALVPAPGTAGLLAKAVLVAFWLALLNGWLELGRATLVVDRERSVLRGFARALGLFRRRTLLGTAVQVWLVLGLAGGLLLGLAGLAPFAVPALGGAGPFLAAQLLAILGAGLKLARLAAAVALAPAQRGGVREIGG